MTVIDTNDNVSPALSKLKMRGVTAIGRYYSSKAWKRITALEAKAIAKADIDIFTIFEDGGDPELSKDGGIHDAQIALSQARTIGQPEGSAIYFALEHLPHGYKQQDLAGVMLYVGGLREALASRYKLGIYSDGVVCAALLDAGLCDYAWLSASRAFEGSTAFYQSRRWNLAQDPKVDQDWEGVSVDLNEARSDFGAFRPIAATNPATLSAPVPGAAGFPARAAAIAAQEWDRFGRQTYDIDGHNDHAGHSEGEDGFYQRIGEYWLDGTGTHGIDGRDHDQYWSAAFISWVMKSASAGDRFRYSTQHSVYIFQGIRDFLRKREDAGYWTVRLNAEKPEVGDLICWSRQTGIDYDHQNQGNYPGHTDVVVEIGADRVLVIGGNVGDSVTRRPVPLDPAGFVKPFTENGEDLFALMKCRIA